MIYTITVNPSVDYIVGVDPFKLGDLNITTFEEKHPGGKGINVSQVLHNLGHPSIALGFVGGFTGDYIQKELEQNGIKTEFIQVAGDTRINMKLKTGIETEINGQGPKLTEQHLAELLDKLDRLTGEDLVIIAGSIPSSLPNNTYQQLVKKAKEQGAKVILDAKGNALKQALTERPFLVKPNHHELGDLFDVVIDSPEAAIPYARKLIESGVENVIVSLGGEGALLVNNDFTLFANAPSGQVKNSVGAGDSVVAGFTAAYLTTASLKEAFRYGVATGSATAFTIGLGNKQQVEALIGQIEVKTIGGSESK